LFGAVRKWLCGRGRVHADPQKTTFDQKEITISEALARRSVVVNQDASPAEFRLL
jgi:hypothetical protein